MAILRDIVTHMKTTVEIGDGTLIAAKELARRDGTTLRNLIEEGLRLVLEKHHQESRFRLRNASVNGEGIVASLEGSSWSEIKDLVYEDHGA